MLSSVVILRYLEIINVGRSQLVLISCLSVLPYFLFNTTRVKEMTRHLQPEISEFSYFTWFVLRPFSLSFVFDFKTSQCSLYLIVMGRLFWKIHPRYCNETSVTHTRLFLCSHLSEKSTASGVVIWYQVIKYASVSIEFRTQGLILSRTLWIPSHIYDSVYGTV